eukprot:6175288-Pleurochrysis_carterae.AAC.1
MTYIARLSQHVCRSQRFCGHAPATRRVAPAPARAWCGRRRGRASISLSRGGVRACACRAAEQRYVEERDAAMMADSWESVCKLVDVKEKEDSAKDTSRMRQVLLKLKHT